MTKPTHMSEEEAQQLQRTVEMFEAITQAQPDDYQSIEILKEAYNNLGRKEDSLRVSLKLTEAYEKQGQVFKAILECEGILQDYPDEANIRKRLTNLEVQAKLNVGDSIPPSEPTVVSKPVTIAPGSPTTPSGAQSPAQLAEEGDRTLAEVLIGEKLV